MTAREVRHRVTPSQVLVVDLTELPDQAQGICSMSTFSLPNPATGISVPVQLPDRLSQEELLAFPPFKSWLATLQSSLALQKDLGHRFHDDPYELRSIAIQSVDFFGPRLGFVKLKAEIKNARSTLPGIAFLRGGSVAVLMIRRPRDARDERWVMTSVLPRISTGSLSLIEIPAGMIDDAGTFAGAAAYEIKEETGFTIHVDELVDVTALALEGSQTREKLQTTSPGTSDDHAGLLLWEKVLDRQEIEDLKGKFSGLRSHSEIITLRLCEYEELWREGVRDAKTLAAWALHGALKRSGRIS